MPCMITHCALCRAEDLGYGVWRNRKLEKVEIIPVTALCGQFALATVSHKNKEYWVTMSLCHVHAHLHFLLHTYDDFAYSRRPRSPT